MGKKFSESQKEAARVPYAVKQGDNDTPRVDIDGRLYTPQELSAMTLQKMKKTAEDYLGQMFLKLLLQFLLILTMHKDKLLKKLEKLQV